MEDGLSGLCDYGCGSDAKFLMSSGKKCCSKHYNSCEALRQRNAKGVSKAHRVGRGYSFTDDNRLNATKQMVSNYANKIFVVDSKSNNDTVKKYLLEHHGVEPQCNICGVGGTWAGQPLTLQLDHINGVNNDNRVENLRLLCPNCHSQTDTYGYRGGGRGHSKVSDAELIDAVCETKNIRQALMKVGLSGKGWNYVRVKNLIHEHDLKFKQ